MGAVPAICKAVRLYALPEITKRFIKKVCGCVQTLYDFLPDFYLYHSETPRVVSNIFLDRAGNLVK